LKAKKSERPPRGDTTEKRAERELGEAKKAFERKASELHRQREWFRVTLASIGDAVITTDVHGRINFMNPMAEEMTGWKAAEAIGQDLTTVFHVIDEKTGRPAPNPVEKVLAKDVVAELASHTVLVARDGTRTMIDDSVAPIKGPDGKATGAIMVFHDATERHKAQAALQRELAQQKAAHEARAFLAAVIESSDDAIVTKTLDGIITSWNQGAQRIFGYAADEVIGRPVSILIPEDKPNEEPAILQRLKRGEKIDHYETVRRRKDGTLLNISLTVSPIRDEAGKIIGASKIARDITERVRAEAALRDAQERLSRQAEELEKQVNERTASLRQTLGELEAFSYSISHDLRAPLRAMQSFSVILGDECGAQIGPAGKEYLARIKGAAERMDRLIHDVLNYSRVARGELPLTRVEIEKLLREILELYPNLRAPATEIELKGDSPAVLTNEAVLAQCISNLLGNAVKFVQSGVTPRITVWSAPAPEGKKVRLYFKDNGIGIDPALHEKIFGIFERLSTRYEGTGIGLAIVKKGMERMGGSVGVQSAVGQGSTFWLELPIADESPSK
jgi:PAS domain S-box-containing protein